MTRNYVLRRNSSSTAILIAAVAAMLALQLVDTDANAATRRRLRHVTVGGVALGMAEDRVVQILGQAVDASLPKSMLKVGITSLYINDGTTVGVGFTRKRQVSFVTGTTLEENGKPILDSSSSIHLVTCTLGRPDRTKNLLRSGVTVVLLRYSSMHLTVARLPTTSRTTFVLVNHDDLSRPGPDMHNVRIELNGRALGPYEAVETAL